MSFKVINNPSFKAQTGFTNVQFKKLDDLYCLAAAEKVLTYRTVDVDFDKSLATYTYFQSQGHAPYLQFVVRKVGPRAMMYEVFQQGKGRVSKSGVFEYAHKALSEIILELISST